MEVEENTRVAALDCCPPLRAERSCDTIDIKYRLPFRARVGNDVVTVEVVLHFRFERCTDGTALGDLLYSTTLFPGEKVRLFTSDRHTRWSFDPHTSLAHRSEATSEESFLLSGMAAAMSDLTIVESGRSGSTYNESALAGGGGAGLDLGIFEIGGGVSGSAFNAIAARSLARSLSRHAESSSRHVEAGIRAASSTSVGEVEQRGHAEGESESHLESASRTFSNPNRCRAITYLFYKLVKCQSLRFDLIAIDRRVVDPAAPTGAIRKPSGPSGQVAIRPQAEWATMPESMHDAALKAVDEDLLSQGLINRVGGEVSEQAMTRFSWRRRTTLPAAGIIVRGCLDQCNICEPALLQEIELELEHKRLRNELLKKKIELLERSRNPNPTPADP